MSYNTWGRNDCVHMLYFNEFRLMGEEIAGGYDYWIGWWLKEVEEEQDE